MITLPATVPPDKDNFVFAALNAACATVEPIFALSGMQD
jgi:hypothetical protein